MGGNIAGAAYLLHRCPQASSVTKQKSAQGFRQGGTMVPPKKNGVLEVVDDPPWSCDPTVQSIWLAVPEEVEEKGGAIFLKKGKSSVPCACGAVLLAM